MNWKGWGPEVILYFKKEIKEWNGGRKLIVAKLLKKFSVLHGTRSFVVVLRTTRHKTRF
jgi:hypothetical protein